MMSVESANKFTRQAPVGFTIIEIVVASSIALFVFLVGYGAISSTVSANNISTSRIRDSENARLFFNMVQRDLTSAYPGPTFMNKTVPVPLVTGTTYTPPTSGNAIVVSEQTGRSDILQFYCRTDHSPDSNIVLLREPILFVQYIYNRIDGTLCRRSATCEAEFDSLHPPPDQLTQYDPLNLSGVSQPNLALFDNVARVNFTYLQWLPSTKVYVDATNFAGTFVPDAIRVTIQYGDERNGKTGTTSGTSVYRTFSRVIPLPSSFNQ